MIYLKIQNVVNLNFYNFNSLKIFSSTPKICIFIFYNYIKINISDLMRKSVIIFSCKMEVTAFSTLFIYSNKAFIVKKKFLTYIFFFFYFFRKYWKIEHRSINYMNEILESPRATSKEENSFYFLSHKTVSTHRFS